MQIDLRLGDCFERMGEIPDASVEACICDPPYGLDFCGAVWDRSPNHPRWLAEVYRVLKPGGVVKAFAATRTMHRLAGAMEDTGFVDVQLEAWIYSSGFPKSKCVSLFIDKLHGHGNRGRAVPTANLHLPSGRYRTEKLTSHRVEPYTPKEPDAILWLGWGTSLKPAWEPFIVGHKP